MTPIADFSSIQNENDSAPFFTVAIPQYNRRRYLEVCLDSIFKQTFSDFEILVSDDCSADDSKDVIPTLLADSGRAFSYYVQPHNLGYDKNVRFCLRNARGRYVLMLGNDDSLSSPSVLADLAAALKHLAYPGVAVTNYRDWQSKQTTRRVYHTQLLGRGAPVAVHYFRSFSFTSGLIFESRLARHHETDKWDRSIYYQIYLACRILASGEQLAGIDVVTVDDHIRLGGLLTPETYRVRFKDAAFSLSHRHTGLDSVARVTFAAIAPCIAQKDLSSLVRKIYQQLLTITYPYWLFEYRHIANWGYAFGVARDLWPARQLKEYPIRSIDLLRLWLLYFSVTAIGLVVPEFLFNKSRHRLAAIVRRLREKPINS